MSSEEKKFVEIEQARERLIRWEANRRELLTNSIKLILTLATGLLGFVANMVKVPSQGSKFWWIYVFLGLSILMAISAGWTRFFDFRHTTDLNRLEYYDLLEGTDNKAKIDEHRKSASRFGTGTFTCAFFQVLFFVMAVALLCI